MFMLKEFRTFGGYGYDYEVDEVVVATVYPACKKGRSTVTVKPIYEKSPEFVERVVGALQEAVRMSKAMNRTFDGQNS